MIMLQFAVMQAWRWDLIHALHLDPEVSRPDAFSLHAERVMHGWMQLVKAMAALSASFKQHATSAQQERFQQVALQLDAAFGLGEIAASKPYLWKRAGHPILPKTLELSMQHATLLQLCTVGRYAYLPCPLSVCRHCI